MEINNIVKRDFTTKPFEISKITNAVLKAMTALEHGGPEDAERISEQVYTALLKRKKEDIGFVPTVELVQDEVENALMASSFFRCG
jgi:ribonucleoside-diphosphate reductase beta chain